MSRVHAIDTEDFGWLRDSALIACHVHGCVAFHVAFRNEKPVVISVPDPFFTNGLR